MKMSLKRQRLVALAGAGIGLAVTTAAQAEIHFNGFGQAVVGSTLSNDRPMDNRTNLGDYGADANFRSESLFGLQAQAPLNDRLSATVQIVATGAPNGTDSSGHLTNSDFTPKFAWAYASYQLTDNWSVKGGRQRSPLYHYSDYLQVGEAYTWIRPPLAVYSSPVNDFDGLSLNGNFSFGDWYIQPEVYYGDFNGNVFSQGNTAQVKLTNTVGAVFDATYSEWLELRLAYVWSKVSTSFAQVDQLRSGLEQYAAIATFGFPPGCTFTGNPAVCIPADATGTAAPAYLSAANSLAVDNKTIQYYSAGVSITKYNFILDGEYIWQRTPSFLAQSIGYYASLGYHLGRLTPVLVYGRANGKIGDKGLGSRLISDVQTGDATLTGTILEGASAAQGNPTLLQSIQTLVGTQHTVDDYYEFGLRYDLTRNTALKLDYTYYASPLDPATNPGQGAQHAQLISAGVVFTF